MCFLQFELRLVKEEWVVKDSCQQGEAHHFRGLSCLWIFPSTVCFSASSELEPIILDYSCKFISNGSLLRYVLGWFPVGSSRRHRSVQEALCVPRLFLTLCQHPLHTGSLLLRLIQISSRMLPEATPPRAFGGRFILIYFD